LVERDGFRAVISIPSPIIINRRRYVCRAPAPRRSSCTESLVFVSYRPATRDVILSAVCPVRPASADAEPFDGFIPIASMTRRQTVASRLLSVHFARNNSLPVDAKHDPCDVTPATRASITDFPSRRTTAGMCTYYILRTQRRLPLAQVGRATPRVMVQLAGASREPA